VTIDGGILNCYNEMYLSYGVPGSNAKVVLLGGQVSVGTGDPTHAWTIVGVDGSFGTLTIHGGVFNAGTLGIPRWWTVDSTDAGGYVDLRGGVLNVSNLIISEDVQFARLNVAGGELVWAGNNILAVEDLRSAALISAYEGRGELRIDFDQSNPGATTVTAIEVNGVAWNPDPADGETTLSLSPMLTWSAGDYAQEIDAHEIYFGTNLDSVSEADLGNPMGVFVAAQDRDVNSYSTGLLSLGRTYYWRVDEVNEDHPSVRWKGEVWRFDTDTGESRRPVPALMATNVPRGVVLTWQPGHYALSHDVYFGDSYEEVNQAENLLPVGGSVYKGSQPYDSNSYVPDVPLEFERTYYWRIDELNPAGLTRGPVWNFTVAANLVDNFESYYDAGELLGRWVDGSTNGTGSAISLYTIGQAMQFDFNNVTAPWYSESELAFLAPRDFSGADSRALSLRFRGSANNGAAFLYLLLNDGDANSLIMLGDVNAVKEDAWQTWDIDTQEFGEQGVDLAHIEKFAVGFGNRDDPQPGGSGRVYFDDVILYPSRCVPGRPLLGDVTGDCAVDTRDLSLLSGDWLRTGYNVNAEEPNNQRLLAHYTFDETMGTIAHDESGMYDAVVDAYGANAWDPCGQINGCLDFDGSFGVAAPAGVFAGVSTQFTVSLWVNCEVNEIVHHIAEVEFGAGQVGTDQNSWDRLDWLVIDADAYGNNWNHFAFIKDTSVGLMRMYCNGLLVTETSGAFDPIDGPEACQTMIGVSLNSADYFRGKLDDLRMYDYALAHSEVLFLARGAGSSIHQELYPVLSSRDLLRDGKIDFGDYAVLAEQWLDQGLWP
jgi:hypothetical protein